jgi:hypothetical protein
MVSLGTGRKALKDLVACLEFFQVIDDTALQFYPGVKGKPLHLPETALSNNDVCRKPKRAEIATTRQGLL